MSRTYRKDIITTKYSLIKWVNRELFRYHGMYMWYTKRSFPRIKNSNEEIITKATNEWNRYQRDGKGITLGSRTLACEGRLVSSCDSSRSMKKLGKRKVRKQLKELLRKGIYDK